MRQAGVLAAAGLIAMEEMPKRLDQDHANARVIAERLAQIPALRVDPETVRTNVVVFDIASLGIPFTDFSARVRSQGVAISTAGGALVRALTHLDVSRDECVHAAEMIAGVVGELIPASARA
jgi:threonine aldolase